uniref:Uncharacterized protein n=1 Tax=viral metagenome TaxID=1070528 RepID=A0A6M3M840_9ZZZZ
MTDLWGQPIPPKRSRTATKPQGHYAPPGSGPPGETCGTCRHLAPFRRWHKCQRAQSWWTGGRGTDVRKKDPACSG